MANTQLMTVDGGARPIDQVSPEVLEMVIGTGDLKGLSPGQRVMYYRAACESMGLNPLGRPFEFVVLSGQLRMYANKGCAEQLRQIRKVSIGDVRTEIADGLITVTVSAKTADGREDMDIGAVPFGNLQGEARANAMMKAITKAKRRVTLSICGMGMLDESEIDSIAGAKRVKMGADGEIIDDHLERANAEAEQPAERPRRQQADKPITPQLQAAREHFEKALEGQTEEYRTWWIDSAKDRFRTSFDRLNVSQVNTLSAEIEAALAQPVEEAEFRDEAPTTEQKAEAAA